MELTQEEVEQIRGIKDKGFAVVIITPEELEGADSDKVEDRLVELSWEIINDLKQNDDDAEE